MKIFLQKQRYFVDYTLAALLRRKIKNLSLLVVYTLIVFFLGSVMLFSSALKKESSLILENSPQIILQRQVAGRHALIPENYLEKIGQLRGVTNMKPRLWGYYYDSGIKANYTLMVPHTNPPAPGEAIIGSSFAKIRTLIPGSFFNIYAADGSLFSFTIKAVISPASDLVSSDLMLICESDFRRFFSIPNGMATDIVLEVANPREVINIANKVSDRLPDTRPILKDEILRTYDAVFNWRQGIVLVLLSGSVLAFFILAWEKASGLSGDEKREIGILKAIGWETGDVLRMKFWEGAIISVIAFFSGYLFAYIHIFHSSALLFEPVLKGWATLYPSFKPVPHVDIIQVGSLFFFTVFPYTVATIIPVWRAAIIDPDEVMR